MRICSTYSQRFLSSLATAAAMLVLFTGVNADAQDDLEFEEEEASGKKRGGTPPPDTKPPSKTLDRAIRLYEKRDYYSTSIELNKVLAGETGDSAANKQRAEFFMAKTLYQMRYYAGALGYFEAISEKGTAHRYYSPSLKWLAALSRVLPETSGILAKIGRYDVSELDQPALADVRQELFYLLGRHFYRKGELQKAVDLFKSVEQESEFFVKAKFFEGVTYVRQNKGPPALDAFKELLVIGQERAKYRKWYSNADITRFEELARLQLARVFYTNGKFETSIRYYEKIDELSPDWANTLFEASWAYFMRTNYSKALGNIHSLNAPFFEEQFFPESMLLSAVMYYKYCQYDRALEKVKEYDEIYRPFQKALGQILRKHEDNADFYAYSLKIMKDTAGLNPDTARLVKGVLADRTLRKAFTWVDELNRELAMYTKADKAWKSTKVANDVETELSLQLSDAEAAAGKLARERITRLEGELRQFSNDGTKIQIETLERAAGKVSAKARKENVSGSHKEESIKVDEEHFTWRFNGEYWKDELGFYRFRIRSKCPKK